MGMGVVARIDAWRRTCLAGTSLKTEPGAQATGRTPQEHARSLPLGVRIIAHRHRRRHAKRVPGVDELREHDRSRNEKRGRGSITDDALTLLREKNIADDSRTSYPKYSIEEIIRRAPDVIFIGRGTGMEKVSEGLLRRLKTVPAVKNGKVFYVSDYLYRLTPRTVKGMEELAGYLGRQE